MSETTTDTTKVVDPVTESKAEDVIFDSKPQEEVKPKESTEAAVETKEEQTEPEKKADEPKQDSKEVDAKLELKDGLTQADLDEVQSMMKEYSLSKEAAQKILDSRANFVSSIDSAQKERMKKVADGWKTESMNDPEIGGDKLVKSVNMADRAIKMFAPQGFREILDETGLGNHPLLVKFLARVGKQIDSDSIEKPLKSGVTEGLSIEDRFYR